MKREWRSPDSFSSDDWSRLRTNTEAWWSGDLDRPLIAARVILPQETLSPLGLPVYHNVAQYRIDEPMEAIIETYAWYLRRHVRYSGDAYPDMWANFGPTFLSALAGGELVADESTTWVHKIPGMTIDHLHFHLDANNAWHRRYEKFCRDTSDYWQGKVQIGYCTGGLLDAISALLGTEELLFALVDEPEEVLRALSEAEALSWHYYHLAHGYLSRHNPGYSCWAGIFSEKPYQILVSDSICQLSPEMFKEFAFPALERFCKQTDRTFYHLDGPGALRHLDSFLSITELKGIQWVPGAGETRPWDEWSEVIRRILGAGKKVQLSAGLGGVHEMEQFDRLVQKLGTGKGITANLYGGPGDIPVIEKFLERHGVI
ncbi:MAG: hypothetical protein WC003_02030 [Terrimicrobiaceae bacterium]